MQRDKSRDIEEAEGSGASNRLAALSRLHSPPVDRDVTAHKPHHKIVVPKLKSAKDCPSICPSRGPTSLPHPTPPAYTMPFLSRPILPTVPPLPLPLHLY